MYPVDDYPSFGIHVKEQIQSLRKLKNIDSDLIFINGRRSRLNYIKSIFTIKNKIKNNRYDIIHIHYGISGLFLFFFKPPEPIVITLHSGELFGQKSFINRFLQKTITLNILKYAKKVIVLNDETIELLYKYKNKLIKLPCGININQFDEIKQTKSTSHFKIGFPSNRQRIEKNYQLFIKIINELKKDFEIKIIEFANMSRQEVLVNLNDLDLLLMTSLVEGSPQIIKEAMACNKPIISTAVGDVEDLLNNVDNCYVVNTFNSGDFISPIQKILNLPPEKRKSNGRLKLIEMGMDEESISARLYNVYESITYNSTAQHTTYYTK